MKTKRNTLNSLATQKANKQILEKDYKIFFLAFTLGKENHFQIRQYFLERKKVLFL